MKIAIANLNLIPADIEGNLKKIIDAYKKAVQNKCDLIIYPELTIVGYIPGDILNYKWFVEKNIEALKRFASTVNETAAVVGFVDKNQNKWGKPLKNAAAFIENGIIKKIIYKKVLPYSDIFYEPRYFESDNSNPAVINYKGKKILITICADIWYGTDVISCPRLIKDSPLDCNEKYDMILNLSASPYYFGKIEKKIKILKDISIKRQVDIIYVNISGANENIVFDGTSFFISKRNFYSTIPFEDGVSIIDTDNPYRSEDIKEDISFIKKAIIRGIKDFFKKQGLEKAIIGLSGGIDSAVVTCLCSEALGEKNIKTLILPSKFTSKRSIDDAKKLSYNLNIDYEIIPINTIYDSYLKSLSVDDKTIDIAIQNIQARIRANILMFYANKYGYTLINTSNKSEIATGYSTMYGDSCGAISPIGDLLKTDVYKLAEFINKDKHLIPKSIIERPPTAELKPKQKDEDDLPPYRILDQIIRLYVEEKKDPSYIVEIIKDRELVLNTINRIELNQYKRKQMPPIIKLSKNSFDDERRTPIIKKLHIYV